MKQILSNKVYDILFWLVVIVIPALSVLWTALSQIWGFPYGTEIGGTIDAVAVFLGVVMGVSKVQYKKNNTSTDTTTTSK